MGREPRQKNQLPWVVQRGLALKGCTVCLAGAAISANRYFLWQEQRLHPADCGLAGDECHLKRRMLPLSECLKCVAPGLPPSLFLLQGAG